VVAESRPVRQGNWTAQVGSFSKKSSAARIIRELEAAGFDAYISEMTQGGRTLYRVRVGPVVSRDEADALVATLKASGHAARVMPHP
jgi:DedD protein